MNLALAPFKQQSVTAYRVEDIEDPVTTQLQLIVQSTYQWADRRLKKEAHEHLYGLTIAYQCSLFTQVELYKNKIKEIVTRDVVKKTTVGKPQYNCVGFVYPHPENQACVLTETHFRGYIILPGSTYGNWWNFHQIDRYNHLIPPLGLHVLAALDQLDLALEDLWVAEKSNDPILFARFGLNFVALAIWV